MNSDRIRDMEYDLADLRRQIAGLPVRWAIGSVEGGGDHFQIVRGTCVADVLVTDLVFQIQSIHALEDLSELPASPLWVANIHQMAHTSGDTVHAIYNEAIYTIPEVEEPPTPAVQVDWEELPTGGTSAPPLYDFICNEDFTAFDVSFSAYLLDYTGLPVGSPIIIYNTGGYSGRTNGTLYAGSPAFRGQAIKRVDLYGILPPIWEIVTIEGLAPWISGEVYYKDSPINEWRAKYTGVRNSTALQFHLPVEIDGDVLLGTQPTPALFTIPEDDTETKPALLLLDNPSSTPPTYLPVSGSAESQMMYVAIDADIAAATMSNIGITPVSASKPALEWNGTIWLFGPSVSFYYNGPDPIDVPSGRFRVGTVRRDADMDGNWVLVGPPSCMTFPEPAL